MKRVIIDLLKFIRLKVCVFVCAVGLIGYLLFNSININLIFVALSTFLGAAGSYSLNNIKDKEEDLINRKTINPFTLNKKGLLIAFACFLAGLIFSLFLSIYSIVFFSAGVIIGIIYSFFKIKKYFLVKNLYTGLSAALMFLIGTSYISPEIIHYYLLISFFVFIGSVISDLRDYKGDKRAGIRTLPVVLGNETTRKIVFALLSIFSFFVINSRFIILIPFSFLMIFFIYKNKPVVAHSLSGFSLVFLVLFLVMGGV